MDKKRFEKLKKKKEELACAKVYSYDVRAVTHTELIEDFFRTNCR